jgi:hypothetical protein
MLGKYKNEDEIYSLLRSFEDATVARDAWKHNEHLVVALCYVTNHDLETATEKMRLGLFNLLEKGFGVDLSKDMPYHETLTVFWMRTVYAFTLMTGEMPLTEKANTLVELFDKDYPLRFYSRDRLFSGKARAELVVPDIAPALF